MRGPAPKVAFWVTAGSGHGGGHLSRCITLLRDLPPECEVVLVVPDNEYTRALGLAGGPALATLSPAEGWTPAGLRRTLIDHGWLQGPDLLVIDGLAAPGGGLGAELRELWPGVKVAVIGGPEEAPLDVDLRVIPEAGFAPEEHAGDPAARTVGGAPYVILGRLGKPRSWSAPGRPASLLVAAGSADPFNVSSLLVDAVEICRTPLRAHVVLGGGLLRAAEVRQRVEKSTADLVLADRFEDFRDLLQSTDLALTVFGSTCLELAQVGLPAIAVTRTEEDLRRARRMEELGFLRVAGAAGAIDPAELAGAVDELLGSPEKLRAMSEAGVSRIDGRGAERVVDELRKLLE